MNGCRYRNLISMISDYEQLECNKRYGLFINMQISVQICKSVDNNIEVHLFEQYRQSILHILFYK